MGIVWVTEVVYAKKEGRGVEGVSIPAPYNMADKVGYALGRLTAGRNPKNAGRFMAYLATGTAQGIYAKNGFVKATRAELTPKQIQ